MSRHYNPDWLTDDTLLANFVARQSDFTFLRNDLARIPLVGSVQHYLLIGVRGAGKTTLLKRLAIAIRRDSDLSDHLIALSFPEELYQVKHLADFWWAACDALADELDRLKRQVELDDLEQAIVQARRTDDNKPTSDAGFQLLQQTCAQLQRRPVLLVDNLDMVFERIDKSGRKLKDPNAPAYWALREALSTSKSPVVIGGSVRLTEAFKDYDQAFYDFFLPKRLGKLSLAEVRSILERLADVQGLPDVKERLHARPGRIEMLFELTGGNPRALSLIFDVVRNGPNSRAVEDFERLMDVTTPYYKARIEDLSEQAQVIMHALAVHPDQGVRFGFTAAEIGRQAGLPTTTISSQLTILENEGLVDKSTDHGRAQYRIAEQLFRLWLQMRSNRRIRHNVIGLTKFFEALYDPDELQSGVSKPSGASALADAKFAFAVAGTCDKDEQRNELEAYGTARLLHHVEQNGGNMEDYMPSKDSTDIQTPVSVKETPQEVLLAQGDKISLTGDLIAAEAVYRKAIKLDPHSSRAWNRLGNLLSKEPHRYHDAEEAYRQAIALAPVSHTPWYNLGNFLGKLSRYEEAEAAYRKAIANNPIFARTWNNLGNLLAETKRYDEAEVAYRKAISLDPEHSISWNNLGLLFDGSLQRYDEAEAAFRKAISINPAYTVAWGNLGIFLRDKQRYDEAETAYRKAISLKPESSRYLMLLGNLLSDNLQRYDEAETVYRQVIAVDPKPVGAWNNLGNVLSDNLQRYDEAENAYRQAIALNPTYVLAWNNLGALLSDQLPRYDEAEVAFRKALTIDPTYIDSWSNLAALLNNKLSRYDEAEVAYREAIALAPLNAMLWNRLGNMFADKLQRYDDAESAYRQSIAINPEHVQAWYNLGILLSDKLQRYDDAEIAYRQAITVNATSARLWHGLGDLLADKLSRYVEAETAYRKAIEFDPARAWTWSCLGDLMRIMERYDEAEAVYLQAIAIDPEDAWFRFNFSHLLEELGRFEEALIVYEEGAALDQNPNAVWKVLRIRLQIRHWVATARQAIDTGSQTALREALARLLTDQDEIASVLISEQFIEEFLVPLLKSTKSASLMLDEMRHLGFEKHARPLLLAFEAAIENQAAMLSELEPEIQDATKRLFERLRPKPEGKNAG